MDSILHHIAANAEQGVQINLWPLHDGRYQANVKEQAGKGWTCHTDTDPLHALATALRLRFSGARGRTVVKDAEPVQIDIEEAITAVSVVETTTIDDEIEALLG